VLSLTKNNYLASFKIAYTVNVYPQAKNRMCCDEKQKLSAQERRDMQIISQPTWAIPTTRIRSFYFPNSAFSVYRIGSTSKQFTAACIILLAEKGELKLDANLKAIFPESYLSEEGMTYYF